MLKFFAFIDRMFGKVGALFQSPLLLVLRLFFGIGFVIAGAGKLADISKFTDYLISLNIPYPEMSAYATALTETIGGVLLAIGFLSRIASVPLIFAMGVAYATAHVESVYALTSDPTLFIKEPPFNFLLTSLLVFAFGPGLFSLDALLPRKDAKKEESK